MHFKVKSNSIYKLKKKTSKTLEDFQKINWSFLDQPKNSLALGYLLMLPCVAKDMTNGIPNKHAETTKQANADWLCFTAKFEK